MVLSLKYAMKFFSSKPPNWISFNLGVFHPLYSTFLDMLFFEASEMVLTKPYSISSVLYGIIPLHKENRVCSASWHILLCLKFYCYVILLHQTIGNNLCAELSFKDLPTEHHQGPYRSALTGAPLLNYIQ